MNSSNALKKEEIAATAGKLFAEYGFKSVSMEQISTSASVAKGTLYLYFTDKEDLLTHLVRGELLRIKDMVEEIERESLPFLDEIHQVVYRVLMYRQNQKFIYKLMREALELKTPSAVRAVKRIDAEIHRYLQNRLQEAMDQGIIRRTDPAISSFVILKVYSALAFEWEDGHESLNEKQIAESVSLFIRDGMLIKEGSLNQ